MRTKMITIPVKYKNNANERKFAKRILKFSIKFTNHDNSSLLFIYKLIFVYSYVSSNAHLHELKTLSAQ